MTEKKIHHIIVVKDKNKNDFVGLVSAKDLAKNISKTSKNSFVSKLFEINQIKKLEKSKKKEEGIDTLRNMDTKFYNPDLSEKEMIEKFKIMLDIWGLNDHEQLKDSIDKYIQYSTIIKKFRQTGEGITFLEVIRCEKKDPNYTEEYLVKKLALLCQVLQIEDPKKKDSKIYLELIKEHQTKTNLLSLDDLYSKIKIEDLKKFNDIISHGSIE
jgi:hypothetical protein